MTENNFTIFTIADKIQEKFLRTKTRDFDFTKFSKNGIRDLAEKMRKEMLKANGIGLSANQVGFDFKFFVAGVPNKDGITKFYYIFNPIIEKVSKEKIILEEGCLSVPNIFGEVERPEKLIISGQDKNGRRKRIEATGLLARVFQHEIDHLNGILFIDKAKRLFDAAEKNKNEVKNKI